MGVLRVIAHLEKPKDLEIPEECTFFKELETFKNDIKLAAATHEDVEPVFVDWVKNLDPKHYWEIQRYGCIGEVPLYAIGFWNLLSDYLSHDAITKLRDLGTFYHLLPENPNAAEWLVWWLIGFGTREHLQGIFGGMECIVDKLVKKLKDDCRLREGKDKELKPWSKVTAVRLKNDKFELFLNGSSEPQGSYDRVILALPKGPLEKIVHTNRDAFKAEKEISSLLDSAFAFPMVKLFVVVKNRWWEEDNRANRYATKVPTREPHYWKGHTMDSKQGLIMLYTDRPASSFWANYLPPEEQLDADWDRNPQSHEQGGSQQKNKQEERPLLPDARRERLIKKAVQYINENNLPDVTERDVAWYGIRDWGREPFGGANHAWRPEREYWVVMHRLANIAERDRPIPSIHICGEAYSDYHGFIEGSLRSALYVLHRILRQDSQDESLKWLKDAGIHVESESPKYFEALKVWVNDLDKIPRDSEKESHLWRPRSSHPIGKD